MKNKELIELSQAIQLCGNLKGVKFAYALSKNLKNIAKELEPVQETLKKLQTEHAENDEKGNMIIKDGKVQMVDIKAFNKEYEELMNIDNEVILYKIVKADIPDDITAGQLSGIFNLIEE